MKTLIHKQSDININLLELKDDIMRACFFRKKPEIGDLFMSSWQRVSASNMYLFRIDEIIENRDARVSNDSFNNENAYYKLRITLLNDQYGDLPEEYSGVDTSIKSIY